MNSIVRWILIASIIVVATGACVFFTINMIRVNKKRKELREEQIKITKEISQKESEKKMAQREDIGQAIVSLQTLLGQCINHEIIEFCINSCIRNNYKKVLLVGSVEPYEVITLSNKANADVYVRENEFDLKRYNSIKEDIKDVKHNLILKDKIEDNDFDAILCLNSINNFDKIFLDNEKYLKKGGMFIFANTKSNKSSVKYLTKEIEYLGYRYDVLKWYTGFVTIVK